MTPPLAVNLDELQAAIIAALQEQYPDAHVDFYGRPGERIETPAILLELEDFDAQDPDDIGNDQLPVQLNFNARVVLDYKAGKKQAVKTLSASVLSFIRGKKWGKPVSRAYCVGSYQDSIQGRENDYEVMRVEFFHEALLGTGIGGDEEGLTPWKVYLGIAPEIGPENVDDYELIYEGEDPQAP